MTLRDDEVEAEPSQAHEMVDPDEAVAVLDEIRERDRELLRRLAR